MFFTFYILLLNIYVSNIDNFVLKRHLDNDNHEQKNENIIRFQDLQSNYPLYKPLFQIIKNKSETRGSNLKSNAINNRLSQEMFSIKANEHGKDPAYSIPHFMSPKNSLATPTLELRQKWPIADLLLNSKNKFADSLLYIDEFEKLYLKKSNKTEEKLANTEQSLMKESTELDRRLNETKDKVVGLRSLPLPIMPGRMQHSLAIKQCTCQKIIPTTMRHALRTGNSQTCTETRNADDMTRTTILYSIVPFYVPYDPYSMIGVTTEFPNIYYPYNVINEEADLKPPRHSHSHKPSMDEDLYYEDSDESEKEEEYNNDDYLERKKPKYQKHKNQHRKEILVNLNVKPSDILVSWNAKKHKEDQVRLNNIIDGSSTVYRDTVIKDCYCSASFCMASSKILYLFCLIVFLIP